MSDAPTDRDITRRVAEDTWNNRLAQARSARGMTKTEVAKATAISSPTMTEWENGNIRMLDADKMMRICLLLDISPAWLMFGDGPPPEFSVLRTKKELHLTNKACVFLRAAKSAPAGDKNDLIDAALSLIS